MDFHLLEYIVRIAEENSITKAAEKLYVSQSALNQQLLKLEQELGAQLFYRSRPNWQLTPVGEVYVRGARQALKIRQDTYNEIGDLCGSRRGTLTLGLTYGRGIYMFTTLYPLLQQRFPNLTLKPLEMNVFQQQAAIVQGDIDLGFMVVTPWQRTGDDYVSIAQEEMVVALPAGHPLAAGAAPPDEPLSIIDPARLADIPFVQLFRGSTQRGCSDTIFRKAGFQPQILFETTNTVSLLLMVRSASCAAIIPYNYTTTYRDGIAYFALPWHPNWDMVVSYRKDSYVSEAGRYFIDLVRDYWRERPTLPPQR